VPGVDGRAPGPPTDLSIVEDNNKAQRNLVPVLIPFGAASGSITYYATARNATTITRDMELIWQADSQQTNRAVSVSVVGKHHTGSAFRQACVTEVGGYCVGKAVADRRQTMPRRNSQKAPEAIIQLQTQLDQWRSSTQKGRAKLPESVWQAAVDLA